MMDSCCQEAQTLSEEPSVARLTRRKLRGPVVPTGSIAAIRERRVSLRLLPDLYARIVRLQVLLRTAKHRTCVRKQMSTASGVCDFWDTIPGYARYRPGSRPYAFGL